MKWMEITDIYFLGGIRAQNFRLKSNAISSRFPVTHSGYSECKLAHVSVLFCYPCLHLTDSKIYVDAIVYLSRLTGSQEQIPARWESLTAPDKHDLSAAADVSSALTVNMLRISRTQ